MHTRIFLVVKVERINNFSSTYVDQMSRVTVVNGVSSVHTFVSSYV